MGFSTCWKCKTQFWMPDDLETAARREAKCWHDGVYFSMKKMEKLLKSPPRATVDEPSKPVILCKCGKVLENPRMYAEHCEKFPDHFTKSEPPRATGERE